MRSHQLGYQSESKAEVREEAAMTVCVRRKEVMK